MKIKICGIKEEQIIKLLVNLKVDYAGFIFYKKSKRFLEYEIAKKYVAEYNNRINFVGVFVDESLDKLIRHITEINLKFVQLHGNEKPEYIRLLKEAIPYLNVIKAFRVDEDFQRDILKKYESLDLFGFLFDTYKKGQAGGTGETFNWEKVKYLRDYKNIIISGGINENNVVEAISLFNPFIIDINSGVEIAPGIKSEDKIVSIVNKIRSIE